MAICREAAKQITRDLHDILCETHVYWKPLGRRILRTVTFLSLHSSYDQTLRAESHDQTQTGKLQKRESNLPLYIAIRYWVSAQVCNCNFTLKHATPSA